MRPSAPANGYDWGREINYLENGLFSKKCDPISASPEPTEPQRGSALQPKVVRPRRTTLGSDPNIFTNPIGVVAPAEAITTLSGLEKPLVSFPG